jgi:hypothetical protein
MYTPNKIIKRIYYKYFKTGSKVISVRHYSVIAITLCYIFALCTTLQHCEKGYRLLFLSPKANENRYRSGIIGSVITFCSYPCENMIKAITCNAVMFGSNVTVLCTGATPRALMYI